MVFKKLIAIGNKLKLRISKKSIHIYEFVISIKYITNQKLWRNSFKCFLNAGKLSLSVISRGREFQIGFYTSCSATFWQLLAFRATFEQFMV